MKMDKLFLIISREFLIRVKKKSFIFLTLLTPIFFASLMILPTAIMMMSEGEKGQKIIISDKSGVTEGFFADNEEFIWSYDNDTPVDDLKKTFSGMGFIALVDISSPDSLLNVSVSAYSSKQLNVDAIEAIEKGVEEQLVHQGLFSVREDLALYPSGWAAEVEQAARRAIVMPDAFQSDEALRQKAWQDFR